MKIYPSILTDSIEVVQKQLDLVAGIDEVETVQIDMIDGFFADNLTVTPLDLVEIEFGDVTVDLHLMVDEPLDFVFEAIAIKNVLPIRAMIAQVERMSFQSEYIQEIKRRGWKVGLSLDLYTPAEAIDVASWDHLDIVQLMTVNAGFQDQQFQAQALKKIAELKPFIEAQGREIEVIVDGGVKEETAAQLVAVGVTGVSVGSALWKSTNLEQTIARLSENG